MMDAKIFAGCVISLLVLLGVSFYKLQQCVEEHGPNKCEVSVRLDSGWVCGRMRLAENGIPYASFRGVPYVTPPLGELRFKELEPPKPWDHMYDGTEDGAVCPQKDFIYSRIPLQKKGMSEDCMFVNFHLPMRAVSDTTGHRGLPIIVMVHGGGFIAGSSLTDMHGPEYLLTKDVIVITFNFRIGIFGFLSLNTAKIPGNQALRDVITLLRWVQRNARAIGGDPDNVTLMGHSSGAIMAHFIALSEPAKGLIHKVVLLSGTAIPNCFSVNREHAKSVADRYIAVLGINSTDPEYIHDRLIKEPILNIMNALNMIQMNSDIVLLNLVPVVESYYPNVTRIVDDDPLVLMAKGRGREYPLVTGFTTGEFNYFKWQLLATDIIKRIEEDPTIMLASRLRNLPIEEKQRIADEVMKHYFKDTPTIEEAINNYSDMFFRHPGLLYSKWRSVWGAPVYVYQFSYEAERSVVKEGTWSVYKGVAHVEDLTNIFRVNSILQDYSSYPPKNDDDRMKEWLPTLMVNFANCSNPTCSKNESQWPPATTDHFQYQDIAAPMVYKMSNLTLEQRAAMDLYDRIDVELRNIGDLIRENSRSEKLNSTTSRSEL